MTEPEMFVPTAHKNRPQTDASQRKREWKDVPSGSYVVVNTHIGRTKGITKNGKNAGQIYHKLSIRAKILDVNSVSDGQDYKGESFFVEVWGVPGEEKHDVPLSMILSAANGEKPVNVNDDHALVKALTGKPYFCRIDVEAQAGTKYRNVWVQEASRLSSDEREDWMSGDMKLPEVDQRLWVLKDYTSDAPQAKAEDNPLVKQALDTFGGEVISAGVVEEQEYMDDTDLPF